MDSTLTIPLQPERRPSESVINTDFVLYVEDNVDLRDSVVALVTVVLKRRCVGVGSYEELVALGDEALECGVAILDINLGANRRSGIDAYTWLRHKGYTGRIVFLTGHAGTHPLVVEAHRIGDAEIFSKPIEPEHLWSIVGGGPVTFRDLATRHAWRGAFVAAALNAVGMSLDGFLGRDIPGMPIYPNAISALVGIGLIVFLLIRRQRATVRLGSTVFLVNTAAMLIALWITSGYWAATGATWTPFQANKLGALAVPMLAPQLGVGLVSIAGFAATAVAKFYFLDPGIQRDFPVGEPWFVLIYAVFAGVLLMFRLRGLSLERDMLRVQAEAASADQMARTFLHLRDYTNTPIQTIAFTTALLQAEHRDLKPILDRLDRAVDKLAELSHALTRYENTHSWSPGEESLEEAMLDERLFGNRPRSSAKPS